MVIVDSWWSGLWWRLDLYDMMGRRKVAVFILWINEEVVRERRGHALQSEMGGHGLFESQGSFMEKEKRQLRYMVARWL
jgi:hypothetical protein